MNTASIPASQAQLRVLVPDETVDLVSLGDEIEWLTIPGYMRRLGRPDKPWGPQNVLRFGGICNRAADNLGMPYDCAVDPVLGKLRLYTVGFLDWMYKQNATSLGWQKIHDIVRDEPAPPAAAHDVQEGLLAQARMLAAASQESDVRKAAKALVAAFERQRKELAPA